MHINRLNLALLAINLLVLGVFIGIGASHCRPFPEEMHDGPHMGGGPDHMFGPDFHAQVQATLQKQDANWKQHMLAARGAMQAALAADPFDPGAFRQAAAEFDRLMDEFHDTVHQQINEHVATLSVGQRRDIARDMGNMPLPFDEHGDRDHPYHDRDRDHGPMPPR